MNYTNRLCGIFAGLVFSEEPTLGEVIKAAKWGSNRQVRESGFRVDEGFAYQDSPFSSQRVKEMPRVKDPRMRISHGTAILPPKGDRVVVVIIESLEV